VAAPLLLGGLPFAVLFPANGGVLLSLMQAGGGVDVEVFHRLAGRPNKTRSSGCKLSTHALCLSQLWHGGLRLFPATRFIAQNGRQTAS
jgi:hypothetical protein